MGETSRIEKTPSATNIRRTMPNSEFTPPFPFQHRNSPEDLAAYQQAIDAEDVNALFRRWAEEDETEEHEKAAKEQAQAEKAEESARIASLTDIANEIKKATTEGARVWLTKTEAATYLNVSTRTIDRSRAEGKIKAYQVQGTSSLRYKKKDLDAMLED